MADLTKFFNISNDLCSIINDQGIYKKVNRSLLNTLGYTEPEVINRPFYLLLHPEDVDKTIQEFEDVKKGKRNDRLESRVLCKSGEFKWICWSSIVHDQGLFYSAGQNVTEFKLLQGQLLEEQLSRQLAITNAIIRAQDQERDKLSQDLHDNINQIITTAKLNIAYCEDLCPAGRHLLHKSTVLLQSAINEIRTICAELSTKPLAFNNFYDSIEQLIDAVTATRKFVVHLYTNGIRDTIIPKKVGLAVYRILQEQFTNIVKHSGADQVELEIYRDAGMLTLSIKDNGTGFDPDATGAGNGLLNMKARTEGLKGALTIESAPGSGCVLKANFPVSQRR